LLIGPSANGELGSPFIRVLNVKNGDGWEFVIYGDCNFLVQVCRLANQCQAFSGSENVRNTLTVIRDKRKVAPCVPHSSDSLRRREGNQVICGAVEKWNYPAVKFAVEFNP